MIVTTTNNIEGCPVVEYIDFVCANIVLGVNLFSDIAASFTDLFGGKSSSYQNKLELIQKDVIKELKAKAQNLGANAILSCRIDFDEISGGGKSMFMVSASGTACVVDLSKLSETTSAEYNAYNITKYQLNHERDREYIISKVKEGAILKTVWYEFLRDHPQDELIKELIQRYISYMKEKADNEYIVPIKVLLSKVTRNKLIEDCYNILMESAYIAELITELDLFSAKRVLELCKSGNHRLALTVMRAEALNYDKEQVNIMKEIVAYFDALPDTGKIEYVKSGLLGKESEKFICENGHKNSTEYTFCTSCEVNIKGLFRTEVRTLEIFKDKVRVLEKMFNN